MVESITHLATAKATATPNLNSVVDRATKDLVQLLAQQVLDTKPGTCFVGTQWQIKKWDLEQIHKTTKTEFPDIQKELTDVNIGYWYKQSRSTSLASFPMDH